MSAGISVTTSVRSFEYVLEFIRCRLLPARRATATATAVPAGAPVPAAGAAL
jgi:hypothetical protein